MCGKITGCLIITGQKILLHRRFDRHKATPITAGTYIIHSVYVQLYKQLVVGKVIERPKETVRGRTVPKISRIYE